MLPYNVYYDLITDSQGSYYTFLRNFGFEGPKEWMETYLKWSGFGNDYNHKFSFHFWTKKQG